MTRIKSVAGLAIFVSLLGTVLGSVDGQNLKNLGEIGDASPFPTRISAEKPTAIETVGTSATGSLRGDFSPPTRSPEGSNRHEERIYYPIHNDPKQLADRFMAILPESMRGEVLCRADSRAGTLSVTGAPQVIATADQLIPRMDANLQLTDGLIDYGSVAPDPSVESLPALPSEPYYDPRENRMVRVAWEAEGAIYPKTDAELGLGVLGASNTPRLNGPDSAQIPDVAVYECAPTGIAAVVAQLKTVYAGRPEVTITSDPSAGKILIYTTRQVQEEIRQRLASAGISPALAPKSPTNVQKIGMPERQTVVSEASTRSGVNLDYRPIYRTLFDLEQELTQLFGSRLEKIVAADPNDLQRTPVEREQTLWRYTGRVREGGGNPPATCQIAFSPRQQRVSISGDTAVVSQMKTLLESIDGSGRPGKNRPQYILLNKADPRQIQTIFELQQKPTNPRTFPDGSRWEPSGDSAIVRGQDGSLGDLGGMPTGVGINGGMDGMGGRGQIELVPDFVPLVLSDLDMVILDAPAAEADRIIRMIQKIEDLAAEARLETEVYYLKHVNSVMLGGVLEQLYQSMFQTKQGRVMVYAMQYPNAILLVGWGQAIVAMKELIETFDQPIQTGGSMLQVVSLQYAPAIEMARMLEEYFPPTIPTTGGFSPRIRVFPDSRTNALIIQAAPNDFELIQEILMKLDVNQSKAKLEVRPFRLKNSLAADIHTTLSNAILPAIQGTLPAADAKYPVLQFLMVDADSKKLIESGIMRDVQVTADVQNNQIIVTAPSDCMELMAKLIAELDVAPAKAQLKLYQIRNGDATSIQKILALTFPTGNSALPTIPNADGEDSFVPTRFIVDPRTNAIIAIAGPKEQKIINSLITALDRKDATERTQKMITIRNVNATWIAEAINKYLSEKQRLEMSSTTTSDYQLFDSQVIVVPEPGTNMIIISATEKYLDAMEKLVKEFDVEPAQVVIQVLIAEVMLSDDTEFGFEVGLQDSIAFDRSIVTNVANSATGVPGFDIIGNNAQGNNYNSKADPSQIAGTAVSTLGMGRNSSDLGYGGLVLSASSQSVQLLLRALRDKNRLQILSSPKLQAMNNQQGFILVGQRVPRVGQANMTQYGVSSSVTDANVGIILLITPRISDDGRVIIEIGAEKSSLGSPKDAIPVFSSDGQIITSPTIDTMQVMTAVSAVSGETIVLGGLISSAKEKISRGVPYIADIPILGWLFRYDKTSEVRKELLIVMTPRVLRGSEDQEQIKRIEASKMSWCLADAMAIQGNMGLYDPISGGGRPTKTKVLPFLDMDRMEEIPPSAVKPYARDFVEDYPSTPTGAKR